MLAQQLLNGVMLGATYALFAMGFSLVFGVLKTIDLTYGFSVSAGALIALFLRLRGLPILAALPLACAATAAIAVGLDRALLARLRRQAAPELASLMATIGATIALYAATTAWLGPDIRRFPPGTLDAAPILLGTVRVTSTQLLILLAACATSIGLFLLLRATPLGLAMRATAERPEAASLLGIDTGRIAAITSAIGGALAGLTGVLLGLAFNAIHPYMGEDLMLRGFAVVIAGGLGDVRGALLAGLALGLAETLTAAYLASGLKEAVAFALLVVVLWTRPDGLFGRAPNARA